LAKATGTAMRTSPAPQAEVSAAQAPGSVPPSAQPARTFPLEEQKKNQ